MPAQNKRTAQEGTLKTDGAQAPPAKPEPLETLFSWKAPARPFKKRAKEYFTTIWAFAFLLILIAIFAKEWLLIAVVIAFVFANYVLSTVSPEEVENSITTRGVDTGGKHYPWDKLGKFWFTQKWEGRILNIEVKSGFPRRLILLLAQPEEERVKKTLESYLVHEEQEKTWMDKAGEWLSKNIPLEKTS